MEKLAFLLFVCCVLINLTAKTEAAEQRGSVFTRLTSGDLVLNRSSLAEPELTCRGGPCRWLACAGACAEQQTCDVFSHRAAPDGGCLLGGNLTLDSVTFEVSGNWTSYARACPTAAGFSLHWSAGGQAVCLMLQRRLLPYLDADRLCQGLGSRLARVNTLDMLLLLRSLLEGENLADRWVWVGADDLDSLFLFRWNDGSALSRGDTLWDSNNEGYHSDIERCVSLRPARRLCDNLCEIQRFFFCQFDI